MEKDVILDKGEPLEAFCMLSDEKMGPTASHEQNTKGFFVDMQNLKKVWKDPRLGIKKGQQSLQWRR